MTLERPLASSYRRSIWQTTKWKGTIYDYREVRSCGDNCDFSLLVLCLTARRVQARNLLGRFAPGQRMASFAPSVMVGQ